MEVNVVRMVPAEEKGKASGAKPLCHGCFCYDSARNNRRRIPEIPAFSGKDAYLWLCRVEKYFHANPVDEHEKLRAAVAALEGEALEAFKLDLTVTWPSFKVAMVRRFQPESTREPLHMLRNIRQTGTVAEYRDLFETLTYFNKPSHAAIPDDLMRSFFMNGLREEIRAKLLKSHKSAESLSDLMDQAEEAEIGPRPKRNSYRVLGEIQGRKVVILIASAATHSLIAKNVVKELRLPVYGTDKCFSFADGSVVKSAGLCRGVKIKVEQGKEKIEFNQDFFVLDQLASRTDVMLGIDWFTRLGSIGFAPGMILRIEVGGKVTTLKADPTL